MGMYTSAEANKLLKKLAEEVAMLQNERNKKSTFVAAIEENIEDVRPDFNLNDNFKQIDELNGRIMKIKHAINIFNTKHFIRGMTIDKALVYIPILSEKKKILTNLALAQDKERVRSDYGRSSNHIEYKYTNYDISEVKAMLNEVTDELVRLQLALDDINRSEEFDIEGE